MSNNTSVHTKKEFIKMLSEAIGNDQVVLWTQNVNTVELRKRAGEKQVTFGFAIDGFDQKDGVNDLYRCALTSIAVCSRDILSPVAKDMVPIKQTSNKSSKRKM
jgi:hypothetical protein